MVESIIFSKCRDKAIHIQLLPMCQTYKLKHKGHKLLNYLISDERKIKVYLQKTDSESQVK